MEAAGRSLGGASGLSWLGRWAYRLRVAGEVAPLFGVLAVWSLFGAWLVLYGQFALVHGTFFLNNYTGDGIGYMREFDS